MYITSSVYIINKHNVFAILIQVSQDSFTLRFIAFDMQYSGMVKGQSEILAHALVMGITKSLKHEASVNIKAKSVSVTICSLT